MNSILHANHICLHNHSTTQSEVFQKIAEMAVANNIATSIEEVIEGLKNREKESTTGFMDGFAIPHTKSKAIKKPGIVIISLANGVEWNSLDGLPTKFVISLLIPEDEGGTTHLTLLSSVSRMLMHSDIRQKLLQAKDEESILHELNQVI